MTVTTSTEEGVNGPSSSSNVGMRHFKSPNTTHLMGRTTGCSFTTTATSLNGTGILSAGVGAVD